WQQYASATAAAYGKELLGFIVPRQLQATRKVIDALRSIEKDLENIQSNTSDMKERIRTIHSVTSDFDQKLVLDRLAIAEGASFKSQTDENFTCLANTRVELLEQILQWVHDPNAKPIFWLNGMAGTGKSTISRTIASSLNQPRYLGASFFFKRGEADRGNVSRLMTTIVREERKLPPDWPGNSEIKALMSITTPLFISAVTACRFIADRTYHPERSLKDILEHQGKSANSGYGATYLPVLHRQIDGLSRNRKDEVIQRFRHIVGTIITLANPLSTSALAQMLDVPQDIIDVRLDMLHSVLYVPDSPKSPIRLLHLSFRDFLVDPTTRNETPLWIDEKQMHHDIAINCLRVMKARLRMDICDMRNPGIARSAISRQSIADCIPQALEYSCLHWTLEGHSGPVHSVVFSPDSTLVASGSGDQTVRLWRADTGQPVQMLEGHNRSVWSVVFSPDSTLVASGSRDRTVRLWRADTGQPVQTLKGHSDWVTSVVFSPGSTLVASGSYDQTVRLWRADTGQPVQMLKGHSSSVSSVVFSPDSTLIASGSRDQTVRLWCADTGQPVQTLKGHSDWVTSVVFSPGSTLVASGSDDRTVRL
ncbi:hypothetical protein S40288_10367, partial [Stachybotrys chartarum IBT 40288]